MSLPECDCYNAGARVEDLPCEDCRYYQRAHVQWGRFSEGADDVVPLANKSPLSAGSVLEVRAAVQIDEKFEPGGLKACKWAIGTLPLMYDRCCKKIQICVLSYGGSSAILNPNRRSFAYKTLGLEHFC